jgi:tetratricopeptide (TPR) repeat protein
MELHQSSNQANRPISNRADFDTFLTTDEPILSHELFTNNPDVWAELKVFLEVAEGWTLGLIEVNFSDDTALLLSALEREAKIQGWQMVALVLDDPELRYVRDAVLDRLASIDPPGDGIKRVIVIAGLEKAIGMTGDEPPLLQDLNLLRDAYVHSVPYPFLVVLPDSALTRLARFAPDFWAWRSGTFRFGTSQAVREAAYMAKDTGDQERFADVDRLKGRIDLLERLLQECCPTGQAQTEADRRQQLQILRELGGLYRDCGKFERARQLLGQGMGLVATDDPRNRLRFLKAEAKLYEKWRKLDEAIERYHSALELAESLEDQQEVTSLRFGLATIYLLKRKFSRAKSLYQECLEFFIAENNHINQASTYHQLGAVAEELREFEEARRNYQQALQIDIEFNDRYSQARTYHQLGNVAQELREFEEARRNYQQALQIKIEFNDRYNQARTYHQLGYVAQELREFEEARRNYQQALQIKIEFNDRHSQASTYHNLGNVAQKLQEFEEARRNYQLALQIFIEFNDRYSQASTYHNLGAVAQELREFEEARRNYQLALQIKIEFNDRHSQASTYYQLAKIDEATGELEQARENYLQDLRITLEFNDEHGLGISLRNLARFYNATQDETLLTTAANLLGTTPDDLRQIFTTQ